MIGSVPSPLFSAHIPSRDIAQLYDQLDALEAYARCVIVSSKEQATKAASKISGHLSPESSELYEQLETLKTYAWGVITSSNEHRRKAQVERGLAEAACGVALRMPVEGFFASSPLAYDRNLDTGDTGGGNAVLRRSEAKDEEGNGYQDHISSSSSGYSADAPCMVSVRSGPSLESATPSVGLKAIQDLWSQLIQLIPGARADIQDLAEHMDERGAGSHGRGDHTVQDRDSKEMDLSLDELDVLTRFASQSLSRENARTS